MFDYTNNSDIEVVRNVPFFKNIEEKIQEEMELGLGFDLKFTIPAEHYWGEEGYYLSKETVEVFVNYLIELGIEVDWNYYKEEKGVFTIWHVEINPSLHTEETNFNRIRNNPFFQKIEEEVSKRIDSFKNGGEFDLHYTTEVEFWRRSNFYRITESDAEIFANYLLAVCSNVDYRFYKETKGDFEIYKLDFNPRFLFEDSSNDNEDY